MMVRKAVFVCSVVLAACGPKDVIPTLPPSATAEPASETPVAPTVEEPKPAEPRADENAALLAVEKAAFEKARPVLEKHCAKCHSSAGKQSSRKKLEHFSMDSYPFGGHHATEIGEEIRKVLGAGGEKPTMPMDKPGAVKGEEFDAIVAWSRAFDASHKAGLHDHGEHGHAGHGDH